MDVLCKGGQDLAWALPAQLDTSVRPGSMGGLSATKVSPHIVTWATLATITHPEALQAEQALPCNFRLHCCQLGEMLSLPVSPWWAEGGAGRSPREGRRGQPGHGASSWQVFAKSLIWGLSLLLPLPWNR